MKEVVYKSLDGINPRKKEVSIQEIENGACANINKLWTCKYFVKSTHISRSEDDLKEWLKNNQYQGKNVKSCHLFKKINTKKNTTRISCKVLGEFFAVSGLTVVKIVYVNSLKIFMSNGKVK